MSSRKVITSEELATKISEGEIDTVLLVFPDLQGRLIGKRVTGHFCFDHVATPEGIEACNYLLAVDVDMTPLPGYEFANWEQGYGDFRCRARPGDDAAIVPWLEKTALVLCDLYDERRPASRSRCRPAGSCGARSSGPAASATR